MRKNRKSTACNFGNAVTLRFDSVSELLEYAAKTCDVSEPNTWGNNSLGFDEGFHDFRTWGDCIRAANYGDASRSSEFVGKLHCAESEVALQPSIEFVNSVIPECGIDIDRYLSGDPECGYDAVQGERMIGGRQFARIVMRCNQTADIAAKTMLNRGIMIASVIDATERAGYRVELWLSSLSVRNDDFGFFSEAIRIKKPEDIFDPAAMAFWLCSPDVFRRIIFRSRQIWCDQHGWNSKSTARSLDYTQAEIEREFGPQTNYIDWHTTAEKIFESLRAAE